MKLRNRLLIPVALLAALVAVSGCKKKQPPPPPPAAMAPAATAPVPTAQLTATPSVISAGDQSELKWSTTGATSVSIDEIGGVPTVGVKTVTPTTTTTYHLVAQGPGGTANASATVTVNAPPAVAVPTNTMSAEEEFKAHVQPIFFNFNQYNIRPDAQTTLENDTSYLLSHPNIDFTIGGYCDERGSDEYNLALGEKRAETAKNALVAAGVAANRIHVISYGKEKPFCFEHNEQCWQLNRRDGFTMDKGGQ